MQQARRRANSNESTRFSNPGLFTVFAFDLVLTALATSGRSPLSLTDSFADRAILLDHAWPAFEPETYSFLSQITLFQWRSSGCHSKPHRDFSNPQCRVRFQLL